MNGILEILLLVLLHIGVLAGLLAVVLGLGGNFILLGLALLTAWLGHFVHFSLGLWLVCAGLVVLGEVLESLLGLAAARGFGASRWGMIGTFVGGLVGAAAGTAVFPIVGSLIGAFVGGFAGAFGGEYLAGRHWRESLKAGFGGFLGRVAATVLKLAVGILVAIFTLKAGYGLVWEK